MPVFLNIITGKTKTSLLCTIIGESDTTLRVRIADQWELDIYKQMILVVDACPYEDVDLVPQEEANRTARSSGLGS